MVRKCEKEDEIGKLRNNNDDDVHIYLQNAEKILSRLIAMPGQPVKNTLSLTMSIQDIAVTF